MSESAPEKDVRVVEVLPPGVDPMVNALQQLAAMPGQPAAQAAALAVDKLMKFLVTAVPSAEPVGPAQPAPVAAQPEQVAPRPPEEPLADVVELWPTEANDDVTRMRADIDDALMPRSLPLEQQLEFMEEPTTTVPAGPPPAPVPPAPAAVVQLPVAQLPVAEAPMPVVPAAPVAPPATPAPVAPVAPTFAVPVAYQAAVAPEQPVVAAEPPQPQVPFWKRELSLGKKKSEKAPKTPKGESVPFWKRELSLGKKKTENAPKAPKGESVPFWKRELSLGKKKQPVAVKAEPKQPSVPFWKRELSFGKKQGAAGGSAKPKLKSQVPLWKRDVASLHKGGAAANAYAFENVVGLRIGSSQLAAALVHNNGSAELVRVARAPLPSGVVSGGEVQDTDGLAEALRTFFTEHKLPRRGVRIGVATNRIGVRVMEVPALDDAKAAENAIRFRAQEVLPFALSEAVLDQVDLGEGPNGTRRVLIAFAHRALVDQYIEACKRAKVKLSGIDFDAFALLRAVSPAAPVEGESSVAVIALAIGHERTIFAVSDGRVCEFTRVLDWGGASLDSAIAETLDVTDEEAARIKLELTLSGDEGHPELTPMQVESARAAIRERLQLLARELVASLQFYQSRPGSLDIGELLITGGAADFDGLADELTRMLNVPVRTADPFAAVDVGEGVDVPEHAGSLAIAVGLGIEEQH